MTEKNVKFTVGPLDVLHNNPIEEGKLSVAILENEQSAELYLDKDGKRIPVVGSDELDWDNIIIVNNLVEFGTITKSGTYLVTGSGTYPNDSNAGITYPRLRGVLGIAVVNIMQESLTLDTATISNSGDIYSMVTLAIPSTIATSSDTDERYVRRWGLTFIMRVWGPDESDRTFQVVANRVLDNSDMLGFIPNLGISPPANMAQMERGSMLASMFHLIRMTHRAHIMTSTAGVDFNTLTLSGSFAITSLDASVNGPLSGITGLHEALIHITTLNDTTIQEVTILPLSNASAERWMRRRFLSSGTWVWTGWQRIF